jgi:hypothetical protein
MNLTPEDIVAERTDLVLAEANAKIAALRPSPHASNWLKTALTAFEGFDAVTLQNDIEILRSIVTPVASGESEIAMQPFSLR